MIQFHYIIIVFRWTKPQVHSGKMIFHHYFTKGAWLSFIIHVLSVGMGPYLVGAHFVVNLAIRNCI